jgi:hypothetical protein
MEIQGDGDPFVIPLEFAGCMIHFKQQLPTTEEINSLKQYCLTKGDTPWNPSSFFDQVADTFYQKIIDNEQKNSLNTKSDNSSDIKVDLVEKVIPKLSYSDTSDVHRKRVKGKFANPNLIILHVLKLTYLNKASLICHTQIHLMFVENVSTNLIILLILKLN